MTWIVVAALLQLVIEAAVAWRKEEKKRRAAALGGARGDVGPSGDAEAILHGDLGAILRRQMPTAADTRPPER
jgi:hypothetical protein